MKLNPEVHDTIVSLVRDGNYRKVAAQSAGISERTMKSWMAKGAEGIEPYAAFACDVLEAEGDAEAKLLATVRAGEKGWNASAWILERRWPARWSAAVTSTVAQHLDAVVDKLRMSLDEETHGRVVEALRAASDEAAVEREQAH